VWIAISSHGLLGPIFFEETVISERYLRMFHNTFVPHILVTGFQLQTQWIMLDGVRPHSVNISTRLPFETDFLIICTWTELVPK
jgi:hypothetical protein